MINTFVLWCLMSLINVASVMTSPFDVTRWVYLMLFDLHFPVFFVLLRFWWKLFCIHFRWVWVKKIPKAFFYIFFSKHFFFILLESSEMYFDLVANKIGAKLIYLFIYDDILVHFPRIVSIKSTIFKKKIGKSFFRKFQHIAHLWFQYGNIWGRDESAYR